MDAVLLGNFRPLKKPQKTCTLALDVGVETFITRAPNSGNNKKNIRQSLSFPSVF
jgi:hypothetical protein